MDLNSSSHGVRAAYAVAHMPEWLLRLWSVGQSSIFFKAVVLSSGCSPVLSFGFGRDVIPWCNVRAAVRFETIV